jgi:hypothetical protein
MAGEREFRVTAGVSKCGGLLDFCARSKASRACFARTAWRSESDWDPTLSEFVDANSPEGERSNSLAENTAELPRQFATHVPEREGRPLQ